LNEPVSRLCSGAPGSQAVSIQQPNASRLSNQHQGVSI